MDGSFLLACALVSGGYLCGSLASAIIVCRAMGLPDPRSGGSGNPGATNVLRIAGKGPAALTLAGDVLKGVLPVLAATALGAEPAVRAATGVAAFAGHLYPVFFGFRGGKGLATALGMVAALDLPVFVCMGLTWLVVAAAFRFSSLASLCAAAAAPIAAYFLGASPWYAPALLLVAVLLFWRHRSNISRLAAGTESRIGSKA